MKYERLLQPIKIGTMELKNRMIMPAMASNFANYDGSLTEKLMAYHEERAKGGWGLQITENMPVIPEGRSFPALPALYNDDLIANHQQMTQRVHNAGGKIAAQLFHAGRQTVSVVCGAQPVAPSAIKDPVMPEAPRALSIAEIKDLIEKFGDSALRAKKAGYDAIELHGGHGYLICEFLSPFSNKRTDEYGGSIAGRTKFALDIIQNVRQKVGKDYPVIFRLSAAEYVDGGLTIEETKVIAQMLEEAGIDCLNVTQGNYTTVFTITAPAVIPRAFYVNNAAEIKSVVNIPVVAVNRINEPGIAESILKSGKADIIAMGRAALADPQFPNKVIAGNTEDIILCIGCVQGCTGRCGAALPITCMVNPRTGREDEYQMNPAETKKKVFVAGGGVTGCEAAIVAAQRGHDVTVFEASGQLGGQWLAAAIPVGKTELNTFTIWQKRQLDKLGVKVRLNTKLDAKLVQQEAPDAVIVATGSRALVPPIKGIDADYVVKANDVLLSNVGVGANVVVIGGGLVGAETADHIAMHGSKTTLFEMLPDIVTDGEGSPTMYLKQRLQKNNVAIYTSTKVLEIKEHTVVAERNGEIITIPDVDTVILAAGVVADNTVADQLSGAGCPVIVAGDAMKVKNGLADIYEGFQAGFEV